MFLPGSRYMRTRPAALILLRVWAQRLVVILVLSNTWWLFAEERAGLDAFPRWQDDRLEGAGGEVFPYEPKPFMDEIEWENPICLVAVPDTADRFLVVERWGKVWQIQIGSSERKPLLNLPSDGPPQRVNSFGLAFHPAFPTEPYLYLRWNRREGTSAYNYLTRYTVEGKSELQLAPDSALEILRWESNGHNGGDLAFGPDGLLYILSGDGASPGDPENVGQLVDDLL